VTTKQNTKGNQKMIVLRGIEFNDARLAKATIKAMDTLESMGFKPCKLTSVKLRKQQNLFGCCHTKKVNNRIVENKITINRKMMESDDNSLQNLLCHELLHSLEDCADCGHDGNWRKYAEMVNKSTGLNIKQYGSYKEYGIEKDNQKTFQCKCTKCGRIFTYTGYRAPRWYVHPERFSHTHTDGIRYIIKAI
jgi:hypothetical protein